MNDLLTPLELGHAMARLAADRAGLPWQAQAYLAFVDYAATHRAFTTEEVRQASRHVPPPPDPRAWGAIALRAKREGVVEARGWTRAQSRSVHGMVVTRWASLICRAGAA